MKHSQKEMPKFMEAPNINKMNLDGQNPEHW
jgi:hypothetical protein